MSELTTGHDPVAISALDSWRMMEADPRAILIDIRSSMEYLFVGHPKGAVHVAWIDEPDWDINPDFSIEVRKVLLGGVHGEADSGGAPIMLICRSGKRSLEAGRALLSNGLINVYHIDEGFEGELNDKHQRSTVGGWRFHDLPWEQC